MHAQSLLAQAMPEHTNTEILQIALRWVHFVAGIAWIGSLYFFNLVNVPFMKTVTDAPTKQNVFKNMTLPTLWWFRWASVVTVFVGFWYWAQTIVAVDARNGGSDGGTMKVIGLFVVLWTVVWAVEFGIIMMSQRVGALNNGWIYAVLIAIVIAGASFGWTSVNNREWESNRLISIGLGGGYGWFMMLNVWGIIWRFNKKIINGALAGAPPANGPAMARQVFLASRTNAWLSLPMLFFMAAASHFGLFGQ